MARAAACQRQGDPRTTGTFRYVEPGQPARAHQRSLLPPSLSWRGRLAGTRHGTVHGASTRVPVGAKYASVHAPLLGGYGCHTCRRSTLWPLPRSTLTEPKDGACRSSGFHSQGSIACWDGHKSCAVMWAPCLSARAACDDGRGTGQWWVAECSATMTLARAVIYVVVVFSRATEDQSFAATPCPFCPHQRAERDKNKVSKQPTDLIIVQCYDRPRNGLDPMPCAGTPRPPSCSGSGEATSTRVSSVAPRIATSWKDRLVLVLVQVVLEIASS